MDQNLIAPFDVVLDSSDALYTGDSGYNSSLCNAAKESDYFTRALPYAQKGSPVQLPLGSTAPLILSRENGTINAAANMYISPKTTLNLTNNLSEVYAKVDGSNQASIYADLSQATAATINQLRFAFQYQKFLEKDALYGSRYWEILKGHFGIEKQILID